MRTLHFSERWSSRFAQKRCIKFVGRVSGTSVKQWSLRFLDRIASRQWFSQGLVASSWVSMKCLNAAGRGILSQSIMHILKTFPGGLAPRPTHFNIPSYLSLYMQLAIGIPICYYC